MNKTLAFVLLLALPSLTAAGTMYRWTDDKGQVHYTQTPPPDNQAKKVEPKAPEAAESNPGMDAIKKFNKDADAASAAAAKQKAEADKKKGDREERCLQAQENIRIMQSAPAHRMGYKNDDGTTSRMSEEEYDNTLADSKAAASRYCK